MSTYLRYIKTTPLVKGLPQRQQSSAVLPGYLGLPFQILVSPFARFDPQTRQTDILMFNSNNLGALVVKEDPHVQNWEDARYGIQEMYIEESWSMRGLWRLLQQPYS